MGILNITPDSFSDGGLYLDREKAIDHGLKMAVDGADIIDIGGESTRPGSDPTPAEVELKRILPVISGIKRHTDALISVDTMKSEVARAAIEEGADIINDISALRNDPEMLGLAVEKNTPVILMHMKENPKTMQVNPRYDDVLSELYTFFEERIGRAVENGLNREKIIIDPGIGFGKRLQDNLTLIRNLHSFQPLDQPILIGISRKLFIGKILGLPSTDRVEGSIASAVISILQGAHILRVHDVAAVKRAVLMAEAIMNEDGVSSISPNAITERRNHVN
jgi:dihydropteroate synthase